MRAIFINAVDQKVEEIQIKNTLDAFYERIGCDMIQCINLGANHILMVDEEGRLRNWKVGFRLPRMAGIAGNAVVVCVNSNGDFTSATASVEVFDLCTEFLDLVQNPLPPPAFGCAFLADLKPETIEAAKAEAMRDLERKREIPG